MPADADAPQPPADAPPPRRAVRLDRVRRARGEATIPVPRSKVASSRAFRRMRSDRMLGVMGVLLVLFGFYLVFNWEKTIEVPPSYRVEWIETVHVPPAQNLTLTEASPVHRFTIEVPEANVTQFSISFFWIDDVGDEGREYDDLSFTLTGPPLEPAPHVANGTADERAGRNVSIPIAVGAAPDVRQVPAETEDEARNLVGDRTQRNGTGSWDVEVRLLRVGDDFDGPSGNLGNCPDAGPVSPGVACRPDPGQWVQVYVEYATYHVEFRPR